MHPVFNIEIHASHACNLNCESCIHYSNHHVGSNIAVEDADTWMKSWNQRVKPKTLSILGGEPTLNPELCRYVEIARENWPESRIRVVTNGFFLHHHPDLPKVLAKANPAILVLSCHHLQ